MGFEIASRDTQTVTLWVWSTSSKAKVCCSKETRSLLFTTKKLITQGEKLETSAKLRAFISNISSPPLKRQYTRYEFLFLVFRYVKNTAQCIIFLFIYVIYLFFLVVHVRWNACVQRKFEGVYLIKNHRNITSCLVIINLDFVVFSLIYFRIASILKNQIWTSVSNGWGRTYRLLRNLLDLTRCPKCMLFRLPDQTAPSYDTSIHF